MQGTAAAFAIDRASSAALTTALGRFDAGFVTVAKRSSNWARISDLRVVEET